MTRSLVGLALLAIAVALGVKPAAAADWWEKSFWLSGPRYDGDLPACDAALEKIAARFATKESRFWNSNLQIVGFERVRQTAFRPWAADTIPRRYCTATATVSDGHKHRVDYSIIEDASEVGASWGVEWCVVGFDRNWAYNPGCRMARP